MNGFVLALSVDQLKNYSLVGAALPIVIGLVLMRFVAKTMIRSVILLVAVVLGVAVFSQRQEITSCYDKAQVDVSAGAPEISCTFFGQDITLTP